MRPSPRRAQLPHLALAGVVGVLLGVGCSLLNPLDITGGEVPSGGAGGVGGEQAGGNGGGELQCPPGEKPCEDACVRRDDPLFGCDSDGCEPCQFGGAEATCSGGECAMRSCLASYADCNGDTADGCEAHLASSREHCAACGQACNVVNGTAACQGSVCAIDQCDDGYRDCDDDGTNGCETNVAFDPDNCDTCEFECAGGAYAICSSGQCGTTPCEIGTAECDGNLVNGCETDTTTDGEHCGFCNNPCDYFPNGSGVCTAGACQLDGCVWPYDNCDGNDANGCETDLTQSGDHCGQCDFSCDGGACANGCLPAKIALGEAGPLGIVVDGPVLYWTTYDAGHIRRSDVAASGVDTLVSHEKGMNELALRGELLFWTNTVEGQLVSANTNSGQFEVRDEGMVQPVGLGTNDEFVFYVDHGLGKGSVRRMALRGSPVDVLFTDEEGPTGITVLQEWIYWTNAVSGEVARARIDGQDRTTIERISDTQPFGITSSGLFVYWTALDGGSVRRSHASGGPIAIVAGGLTEPRAPVVDGEHVYWATTDEIMRAPLLGSAAEVVAKNLNRPSYLAVDATRIYWTEYHSGAVRKLVKPAP